MADIGAGNGLTPATAHICTGTAPPPTSAPGLCAPTAHICIGTGLTHCPHLHWDWAHPLPASALGLGSPTARICTRDWAKLLPTSASGLGAPTAHICAGTGLNHRKMTWRICLYCTGTGLVVVQVSRWDGLTGSLPPTPVHYLELAQICLICTRIRAKCIDNGTGLTWTGTRPTLLRNGLSPARMCTGPGPPCPCTTCTAHRARVPASACDQCVHGNPWHGRTRVSAV